jgi:hypothetical protein
MGNFSCKAHNYAWLASDIRGLHNLTEQAPTEGFEGSDLITFLVVATF